MELNEINKKIDSIETDIQATVCQTPQGCDSLVWPISVPAPYKPVSRHEVIRWDYFNFTHLYLGTDFDVIEEQTPYYKADVSEVVKLAVDNLNKETSRRYIFRSLINGYKQFDPTRGSQYILDLLLYDNEQGIELHKRVNLMRPIGHVEIIPMPYVTETTKINLVVTFTPEYGQKEIEALFKNYAICILGK